MLRTRDTFTIHRRNGKICERGWQSFFFPITRRRWRPTNVTWYGLYARISHISVCERLWLYQVNSLISSVKTLREAGGAGVVLLQSSLLCNVHLNSVAQQHRTNNNIMCIYCICIDGSRISYGIELQSRILQWKLIRIIPNRAQHLVMYHSLGVVVFL